jgi:deoxyribose-phosphate aldolase
MPGRGVEKAPMELTTENVARMVDLSAVRADSDETEVRALAEVARRYQSICVVTLPTFIPLIRDLLADEPAIRIGGAVGFPSGGATPAAKVFEASELLQMGCRELDMVINIGQLLSDRHRVVLEDIRAVVEAAGGVPVKVILECHYLSAEQIRRACELSIEAGAAFVKTGTGWAPTGATLENISLIKSIVGDAIAIKAAGGIRGAETLKEMYRRGATRFGLGLRTVAPILDAFAK